MSQLNYNPMATVPDYSFIGRAGGQVAEGLSKVGQAVDAFQQLKNNTAALNTVRDVTMKMTAKDIEPYVGAEAAQRMAENYMPPLSRAEVENPSLAQSRLTMARESLLKQVQTEHQGNINRVASNLSQERTPNTSPVGPVIPQPVYPTQADMTQKLSSQFPNASNTELATAVGRAMPGAPASEDAAFTRELAKQQGVATLEATRALANQRNNAAANAGQKTPAQQLAEQRIAIAERAQKLAEQKYADFQNAFVAKNLAAEYHKTLNEQSKVVKDFEKLVMDYTKQISRSVDDTEIAQLTDERQQAELELKDHKDKYKRLLETKPDSNWITILGAPSGTSFNQGGGYSAPSSQSSTDEQKVQKYIADQLKAGVTQVTTSDGRVIDLTNYASAVQQLLNQ